MRLFVAIQLSDDMKKTIAGTLHTMKQKGVNGNYVPLQNLHLTLAFIGETDDPYAVKDALKMVSFKPFKLALSDMRTFGDLLHVSVKGNQGLSFVAKSVRDALDQAGIGYDQKKFNPHITVIRKVSGNWKQVPSPKGEMIVKKISLMKSVFKDGKPFYSEVWSSAN
jgi:2'-5' RNA ligase